MKKFVFLVFVFSNVATMAQQNNPPVTGEYYLQGVQEVGSGFKFNTDGSFEFFFSYGALDRVGKGTWEQHGDSLVLNSTKKPSRDFKLVKATKTGSGRVMVVIQNSNPLLVQRVYAELKTTDTTYGDYSNSHGEISFERCKPNQLSLVHEFFPERFSVFDIADPVADYFEFTIEPWIADVAFDHFVLHINNGTLNGPHPLLNPNVYTYAQ